MKIFLLGNVPTLGQKGEIKNVKPGYFLNYLGPQKLASKATSALMKEAEKIEKVRLIEKTERIKKAHELKEKLEKITINFQRKTTAKNKLYGAITEKDLVKAIEEESKISLDKKDIELKEHFKTLGEFTVNVKLSEEVTAKVKVSVKEEK